MVISIINNLHLPGQDTSLHFFTWLAGPEQSRLVSTHFLVLVLDPSPHDFEHLVNDVHCP